MYTLKVSVSVFEHNLMTRWAKEGKSLTDIAQLLQRTKGTVSRHVSGHTTCKAAVGRPKALPKADEVGKPLFVCQQPQDVTAAGK